MGCLLEPFEGYYGMSHFIHVYSEIYTYIELFFTKLVLHKPKVPPVELWLTFCYHINLLLVS